MFSFSSRKNTNHAFLYVLGGLFLILAIASAFMLQDYHETLMQERQEKTRKMVENAYSLVAFYEAKVERGEMEAAQAKHYARETIRQIMTEPNGYFWIIDTYPKGIMHPIRTKWEGLDLSDYTGPDGRKLFVEMVNLVKTKGAGFISYLWAKPDITDNKLYPKTSYLKFYPPWDWIIGTGVYIDDINRAFWNAVIVACGLSIAVLMFVMALAMTVSENLKKE